MFFSLFGRKRHNSVPVAVAAPMSGKVVDLSEVPDKVFSSKMVGEGIAVDPAEGTVVAPFDGVVKQVFPAGHALVVESVEGLPLLIHIGIDTVNLKGEGFKILAVENQEVRVGDPLVEFDMGLLKSKGNPLVSPLVIPDMNKVKSIELTREKEVIKGKDVLMRVFLK
ncbi:PTS sugar transporter subunit IIA [Thermosediminibacter litoriperuensis]|uniref:PTS system glucose-specific IIA component n=1 Tax=Thermosediminibacter litoriperuensis TaxID=291989 RepID=A0A5S5AQ93_9FIRM|nr:PTS glucose transporter subunit IIA [Thermosediminibacter litoriperuensis]TYP54203.1 PTS system glucose-specific IIA component [Thermosediminibacter litoriperuensis]